MNEFGGPETVEEPERKPGWSLRPAPAGLIEYLIVLGLVAVVTIALLIIVADIPSLDATIAH